MRSYLITWRIDIEADSPEEAAAQALIAQRDHEATCTCFEVKDKADGKETFVDLSRID